MRVTVCWSDHALNDLADIYLAADDRNEISAAVNEVDELLKVDPSQKGLELPISILENDTLDRLAERFDDLPSSLRVMHLGPLEVVFTAHELDGQARVWVASTRDR